jgi:hypothetical protein
MMPGDQALDAANTGLRLDNMPSRQIEVGLGVAHGTSGTT